MNESLGAFDSGARPIPSTPGSNATASVSQFETDANDGDFASKFTPAQIELLKAQMAAYKLLSTNMPIPPTLQQIVFGQDQTPYAVISKIISLSQKFYHDAKKEEASFASSLSVPQPPTLDPIALVREREKIISSRKMMRIKELEKMSAHVDNHTKLKALIELKALKLADYQAKLRLSVLTNYSRMTALDATVDPSVYIRPKRLTFKETRLTEKLEKHQRFDRPRPVSGIGSPSSGMPLNRSMEAGSAASGGFFGQSKAATKQSEFSVAVLQHAKEFFANHRAATFARQTKLSKPIAAFHSTYEKEEAKRLEKLAKDRLKALRADDEEAYFKLIDQEKDTRLTHLLKQTDAFLSSLIQRVIEQKTTTSITSGEYSSVAGILSNDASATTNDVDEMVTSEAHNTAPIFDYYAAAHTIKETVDQQPPILVGGTLKDYQMKGLQWMISLYNNRLNGILADEMGLGKTIQTISLISYLMEFKGQNGPYLIIVPLSTLSNWSLEFEKWAPSIVKIEYKGTPPVRKSIQAQARTGKFNVMLTTYEYIIKDKYFLSKMKWLYLIIDEGHRMKNAQSKLSTILTQHYNCRFRLILTGTPLQNNLPELWALLNFVLPKIFNSSKTFDEWFNAPFANTGEKIELNEEEQLLLIRRLHKVLRPFLLRRLKKDVESELPDKVETVVKCGMSALQQSLYNAVQKSTQKSAEVYRMVGGIKKLNNSIMQLRKICNHPFVFEEVEQAVNPSRLNNELLYRSCGKFDFLRHILAKFKATNHRMLIFFQMTQIMTIMEDFLVMLGYKYLRLDGGTKSEDRSEMLAKFNDPSSQYFIFLLSTRAGGLGLNLQSADTVIIYDSDWNPHQDLQAQDRAHRIGQTKEVRILRLVTVNSVEEYILERAQFKLNIDGKVIQAGKFDHKSTNEEREAMLRALLESNTGGSEVDDDNCAFTNEDINELIARNDDELTVFNAIDNEIEAIDAERSKAIGNRSCLPRLMDKNELPAVYRESFMSGEAMHDAEGAATAAAFSAKESQPSDASAAAFIPFADAEYFGPRKTKRTVSLAEDDDMSDDAWLDKLEADEEEAATAAKKRYKNSPGRPPKTSAMVGDASSSSYPPIFSLLEKSTDHTGRNLLYPFVVLPSARDYPDYYQIIEQPICFSEIKTKFLHGKYAADEISGSEQLRRDLLLLFDNALQYNAPNSQIYNDALYLRDLVLLEMAAEGVRVSADAPDAFE